MNRLLAILLVFVSLLCLPARATTLHVTTVSSTASTLVSPSQFCKTLIIQNNGSGDVRLVIDGGTVSGSTDPTTTLGIVLSAGTYLTVTYPGNTSFAPPVVRVILKTATTTIIDVVSDDIKTS